MRGGGVEGTLEAFPIPLGSSDILSNALIAAAVWSALSQMFRCSSKPAARANEAVGEAKPTKNTIATLTGVFDTGKLSIKSHWNAECVRMM
jgi:hypothetical protein